MPSTVIASFLYDEGTNKLTIRFVSGSEYEYYDVPKEVYETFRKFREKGIYYNLYIKGKFRYAKISQHL